MVTLAVVLLVFVVLLSIAVVAGGGESVTLEVLRVDIIVTDVGLFVTGLVAGMATVAAAVLLRRGLRKTMKQRHRLHELEQHARTADKAVPSSRTPTDDASQTGKSSGEEGDAKHKADGEATASPGGTQGERST